MTSPDRLSARGAILGALATALVGGGWTQDARAQPVAFEGPELLLSTGIVSDRHAPGLASGAGGGFFAVWFGALPDGDFGAYYRGFDDTGAPIGEARRARSRSSFFGPNGGRPVIAGDPDAGFVLLQWTLSGNDYSLELGAYRPSGELRAGPFLIGEPVAGSQPAAAALGGPGPHVVVVRGQDDADRASPPSRLLARRFKLSGAPAGPEVEVSEEVSRLRGASVALHVGGGFAVAWTEEEDGPTRLLVRPFDADGRPVGPAVPASPFGGAFPGAALTPGPGDGFTAWFLARPPGAEDLTLWRREIGPDGQARGPAAEVASGLHAFITEGVEAAADTLGNTVVVWSASGPSLDDRTETFARAYDPHGQPFGAPFRVNTDVSGGQEDPAVAAVGPNRFAVAWRSEEEFGGPAEIRGQLLRLRPRQVADEGLPVALAPEQVACDESRLRGLLERLSVATAGADPPAPSGVVLSFTRSGDFAGVAHTRSSGAGSAESQLAFSTNPEETPLLRNPERPPLASVSLSRNPASSDLVPAGAPGELRLVLDPTLQGFGTPPEEALLVIDNVAGSAGTPSSARPGRGLTPVLPPCHDLFAEDDAQVLRVLQKVLRAGVPGAVATEIAAYRGEEPGVFRIDAYFVGSRGESLGRLSAELAVEWTPDGQLWTGEARLFPRCGDGVVRSCTSLARPAFLELVEPTFGAPDGSPPAIVRLEASEGVDPALARRFAWRDLLAGTTWLETP